MSQNSTSSELMGITGQKPIKEIKVPLMCIHKNTSREDLATARDSQPDGIPSFTCSIMIAVAGNIQQADGKSKYMLSLEDDLRSDLSQIVNLNHYSFIKLHQNETKNFTFFHNHPRYQDGLLELVFDGMYGAMDICVKISTEKMNATDCKDKFTLQGDRVSLADAYKKLTYSASGAGAEDYKGTYHIEITSHDFSGLVFGVNEVPSQKQQGFITREIKAGAPVTGTIHSWDAPAFYSFELPPSLEVTSIRINLNAIHGDFLMSIRNDDQQPTEDQNYWRTTEDILMISEGDPEFKPSGFYTIGVFPLKSNRYKAMMASDSTEYPIFDQNPNEKIDYKFNLKLAYTDKHSLLIAGVPEYGRMTHPIECFMVEIWSSWQKILVMKHSNTKTVDMYAKLGNTHKVPTPEDFDYRAVGAESGFQVNQTDVTWNCPTLHGIPCNLHICLYGRPNDDFMVAFTHDNLPFVLRDSKIFGGPMITSNETFHFIYHPSKHSPTDIEEFSGVWGATVAASVVEETNVPFQFPTTFSNSKFTHSNLIHITRSEVNKFVKPVVLISIGKSVYHNGQTESQYDFTSSFSLEAGYYLKELSKSINRIGFASVGQIVYYYIYNNEPDIDIVVNLESMDGGDARIYMSRGNDARPNSLVHEKSSIGYQSSSLIYTASDAKARGYADLRGVYVIGVQGNTDIEYSISWKNANEKLEYAYLGRRRHAIIPPGESIHVSMLNTIDKDIDLHVKTNNKRLMVYYSKLESKKVISQDMQVFPGPLNNEWKFEVQPYTSMIAYTVRGNAGSPGTRHLYTFSNDFSKSPVELDYEFLVSGPESKRIPSVVRIGQTTEDILSAEDKYRMYVLEQVRQDNNIEIKVFVFAGECEFRAGSFDEISQGEKKLSVKKLPAGAHGFSLKEYFMSSEKITRGSGLTLHRLYFEFRCHSEKTKDSSYSFTLVNAGVNQNISPNKIVEGVSSSDDKMLNSYIYLASGNETIFNLEFTMSLTPLSKLQADNLKDKDLLGNRVSVFFAVDRAGIKEMGSARVEPFYSLKDYQNNRVMAKFKPKHGVYLIKVNPLNITSGDTLYFDFTLRLSTDYSGVLPFGNPVIEYLPGNVGRMNYQLKAQNPGQIFFRMHRCFGQAKIQATDNKSRLEDSVPLSFDESKFTTLFHAEKAGEIEYVQVMIPQIGGVSSEFGYLDNSKNASVYSLEILDEDSLKFMSIDQLKPANDNLHVSLDGRPSISFSPINRHHSEKFISQIDYHLVISKDPAVVQYCTYCERAHLEHVLKEGYKLNDAVSIFSTGANPARKMNKITGEPYIEIDFNLDSGHKYFMNIFAVVTFKRNDELIPMKRYRVVYRQIEFEYRSFLYPAELLAATLGLVVVMLGSCWVVKNKLGSYLRKLSGFKRVSSEVDEELEDYYMQVRAHFEESEKEYRSVKKEGSNDITLNTSSVMPLDKEDPDVTVEEIIHEEIKNNEKPDSTEVEMKVNEVVPNPVVETEVKQEGTEISDQINHSDQPVAEVEEDLFKGNDNGDQVQAEGKSDDDI